MLSLVRCWSSRPLYFETLFFWQQLICLKAFDFEVGRVCRFQSCSQTQNDIDISHHIKPEVDEQLTTWGIWNRTVPALRLIKSIFIFSGVLPTKSGSVDVKFHLTFDIMSSSEQPALHVADQCLTTPVHFRCSAFGASNFDSLTLRLLHRLCTS